MCVTCGGAGRLGAGAGPPEELFRAAPRAVLLAGPRVARGHCAGEGAGANALRPLLLSCAGAGANAPGAPTPGRADACSGASGCGDGALLRSGAGAGAAAVDSCRTAQTVRQQRVHAFFGSDPRPDTHATLASVVPQAVHICMPDDVNSGWQRQQRSISTTVPPHNLHKTEVCRDFVCRQ